MRLRDDRPALSRDDYARALDYLVSRVGAIPGVCAVFQFGEISHPGISDLDVLIAIDDDAPARTLAATAGVVRDAGLPQGVLTHPPLILPRACARRGRYLHSLLNLIQVWGRPLDILSVSRGDRLALEVAHYVDFSFTVRGVLRSLTASPVGIRQVLILLKSCLHSLRLASGITGLNLHSRIAGQLADLQDRSGQKDVTALQGAAEETWRRCIDALTRADAEVEARLATLGLVSGPPIRTSISHPDGGFYGFVSPFPVHGFKGHSWLGWMRRLGMDPSVAVYPGVFLAHFAAYGDGAGAYAAIHRRVFGTSAGTRILDEGYRRVLSTRLEVTQAAHDVLRSVGLIPMVPLGIGFRSPDNIRLSRRRSMLRPLLTAALHERSH